MEALEGLVPPWSLSHLVVSRSSPNALHGNLRGRSYHLHFTDKQRPHEIQVQAYSTEAGFKPVSMNEPPRPPHPALLFTCILPGEEAEAPRWAAQPCSGHRGDGKSTGSVASAQGSDSYPNRKPSAPGGAVSGDSSHGAMTPP